MAHPKYELPKDDPHAKYHYEMAMKQKKKKKKAGKSTAELHEIFKKCMSVDLDHLPTDPAHAKYVSAVKHAKAALAKGQSSEEAHELFKKVLEAKPGESHCKGKK